MDRKTLLIILSGIGVAAISYLSGTKCTNNKSINGDVIEKIEEETFRGIPLSKLNQMAKECMNGIKCTIENGFLVFHSTSNSGKTHYHTQMLIDKAGNVTHIGVRYPNQWLRGEDQFAAKLQELLKK